MKIFETSPAVSASADVLLAEGIASMTIDDFATAGLVVTVDSSLLHDTVLLASDNAVLPEGAEGPDGPGVVVYRAAELRALHRLGADGLRQIHRFKRLLGGSVDRVLPRGLSEASEPMRSSA